MRFLAFRLSGVLIFLTLAQPISAKAGSATCEQLLPFQAVHVAPVHLVLSGKEKTLKDLEPVYRALGSSQPFELVIPHGYRFNFEPFSFDVYREKKVAHYPYHFDGTKTEEAQYRHDLLDNFTRELSTLQAEQNGQLTYLLQWVDFLGSRYRFNASPASGKNYDVFAQPEKVTALGDRVRKIGRPPFTYQDANGNWHVTNEHFLRHLKKKGIQRIVLHRAHHGFDLPFYRLLLSPKPEEKTRRLELAQWMREQRPVTGRPPNDEAWWHSWRSAWKTIQNRRIIYC